MSILLEQSPLMVLFPQNAPPEIDPARWAVFCRRRQEIISLRKGFYDLTVTAIRDLQDAAKMTKVQELIESVESDWVAEHDSIMDEIIGDTEVPA